MYSLHSTDGIRNTNCRNNLNYSLDELKNPIKLLPKCAFSAIALTSVLYIGCCISFFVGVPLDVIDPKSAVLAAQFFTRLGKLSQ